MAGSGGMRPLTAKAKKAIETDPFYRTCALSEHGGCAGRITIEHAIIYAGRQLDELWSLIPLCARHHNVDQYQDLGTYNRELSEWVATQRATKQELQAISKAINWEHRRDYLEHKYGEYRYR